MSPALVLIVLILTMFLAATGRLEDTWNAIQGKGPKAQSRK